jgi:hypothetical protein
MGVNETCWVCEEAPAVTVFERRPICEDCFDHFIPTAFARQEYPTADVVRDLRFGREES